MLHLYLTDSFLLDKKIVCCCILHLTKNTEVNFLSGSELFKDEPHIHENLWPRSFVGRPSISSHFFIYFFPDSVKRTSHIVQIIRSPSAKVVIFSKHTVLLSSLTSSEKSGSPSHKQDTIRNYCQLLENCLKPWVLTFLFENPFLFCRSSSCCKGECSAKSVYFACAEYLQSNCCMQ